MMARWRACLLLWLIVLAPGTAWAQGALLQAGPFASGHVPMYVIGGSGSQASVQDSGPAGGGGYGVGLGELGLTVRGVGTPPYASAGTGPYGTNLCDYDAPVTNATGYHYLCLSPNAGGGGLIAYGNSAGASALPFQFIINGTTYPVPSLASSPPVSQIFATPSPAGATQTLTLTNLPLPISSSLVTITFDGVQQTRNTWSINPTTGVITFLAPIPIGTQVAEVDWWANPYALAGVGAIVVGNQILSGTVQFVGAQGVSVTALGSTITVAGSGVTSLNNLTGPVQLLAGSNISITPSGQNLTIAATETVANPINQSFIINGDFLYDQPNEGQPYNVAGTQVPVMDGFDAHVIPAITPPSSYITVQRNVNAIVPSPLGYYNATVTVVVATGASDHFTFEQKMEGNRIQPFSWGTAKPQSITVQWSQFCNTGGNYSLALVQDPSAGRSYVHSYSLTPSQWNYYQVTIPGDTAAGWVNYGTTQALEIDWVLGAATHFQTTTPDAWQSGEFLSTAGQVDLGTSSGNYCVFANIKGEIGSVATPFIPKLPSEELEDAQYYYQKSYPPGLVAGAATSAGADFRISAIAAGIGVGGRVRFSRTMLCVPTLNTYAPTTGTPNQGYDEVNSANVTANIGGGTVDQNGFNWYALPSTGTSGYIGIEWTADCRLA